MKKIITIMVCDLCKSETKCETIRYPVLFTTDQTDGRVTKPYISHEAVDMCKECLDKVIKVTGYGAQGNNTFELIK